MKKGLLFLTVLISVAATAQMKEGKVVYERTIQMLNRFQGMNEEMTRQLPRSRTDHFELQFGNNQSLWQGIPDMSGESNTIAGAGMVMRFRGDDESFITTLHQGNAQNNAT